MHRIIQEVKGIPSQESSDGVQLQVLLAETNKDAHTYDGIDWGGERVAQEICDEIQRIENEGKKVTRFSITGYSLGGLLSRYVIGILHRREVFKTITPVNFNTIATPHIGLLRYPSFWSRLSSTLGPTLLSRTGEQFYSIDRFSEKGRPLLDVMADPEWPFYQGLALFSHIRIYANAVNDITVPYITAAIEQRDPFHDHKTSGLQIEFDKKYSPVVTSWTLPDTAPTPPPKPRLFTRKWFRNIRLPRLSLPPFLQRKFPLNVLIIALLPVLVPGFFILAIIRLSLSARSSRRRIMLLEKETSTRERLMHVVGELERQMEDAVADFVDSSSFDALQSLTPVSSPTPANGATDSDSKGKKEQKGKKNSEPRLTEGQYRMIASLNALPQLKKERAFIDPVRNSHATIISRDVKNFEFHRVGEGVLRHWADHFIL
ncbi:hypothetical protein EW146_g2881 [Bondarzewia mesenterica]|uniref:DUF676 domain-containing protein n=1 Tax=Bondarzewia mesenterica TaxID=1095465 RepID=A0A4S4M1M8_9AGAM|nr:hypothetical protein EW146_g2881 [Bondarzewia mesenterica]